MRENITLAIAILGAVLGVFNTVVSLLAKRLKLEIKLGSVHSVQPVASGNPVIIRRDDPDGNADQMQISVINTGQGDFVVTGVGFILANKREQAIVTGYGGINTALPRDVAPRRSIYLARPHKYRGVSQGLCHYAMRASLYGRRTIYQGIA